MSSIINEQELMRIIRQMVQEELAAERQRNKPGVALTEQQLIDAGIHGLSSKQPSSFHKSGAAIVLKQGEVQHRQRQIEDSKKESIDI